MRVSGVRTFVLACLLAGSSATAACTASTAPGGGGDQGSGGAGPGASGGAGVGPGAGGGARATGGAGPSGSGGASAGSTGGGSGGARATGGSASGGAGVGSTGGGPGAGGAAPPPGSVPFKGIALGESTTTCADIATLSLGWYYNWTTSTRCRGAEFVPMIWGHDNENIAGEMTAIVSAGYKTVLGFNEPGQPGQSTYTVAQALSLWPQLTAAAGVRVGSPATAANAEGQAWFTDFMTQAIAQNLRVDFIALHWYGWNAGSCDANAAALEGYLNWAEGKWPGKPIWLTEWGCLNLSAPTAEGVRAFYNGALRVFAKPNHHVERYGWFLTRASDNTALIMSTGGVITPLGTDYAGAPTFK